jgi:hypothetical protein
MTRRISSARPTTGSSLPARAISVRSREYLERTPGGWLHVSNRLGSVGGRLGIGWRQLLHKLMQQQLLVDADCDYTEASNCGPPTISNRCVTARHTHSFRRAGRTPAPGCRSRGSS